MNPELDFQGKKHELTADDRHIAHLDAAVALVDHLAEACAGRSMRS